METHDFIENCSSEHLTLADVLKLKKGDCLDVVIWDRNYEEYWMWNHAVPMQPYRPFEFYRANRHKLHYLGDYKWNIEFPFGETHPHPIHLWTGDLQTKYVWFALENNYIDTTAEMYPSFSIPSDWEPVLKHVSEFSPSTRVGWRGPIMLWKKLEKMSDVFYRPYNE